MFKRFNRLLRHLREVVRLPEKTGTAFPNKRVWRFFETSFFLADCFYLPETLLFFNRVLKRNTRPMCPEELQLARSIFGNSIDYQKVRIDERAYLGCRHFQFAYVGFNCVNSWGALSEPHFIHELVHVWQYQHFGSVYIPRALYAQNTADAYNYGGIEAIRRAGANGQDLLDFNWEQQGDLVADYFCLLNARRPRWCDAKPEYAPYFRALFQRYFDPKTLAT